MFMPATRCTALLLALGGLLSCGGQARVRSVSKNSGEIRKAPDPGSSAGYAQVMSSRTIDGQDVKEDGRAVALVFFASWCGHCRSELARLGRLRKRFPQVRIIGLNAYEEFRDYSDRERLRTYLASNAPWLAEVVTADEDMRAVFGKVPKIPSLFLYNQQGAVVAEFRRDTGPPPGEQELEEAFTRAVRSPTLPPETPKPAE